VSKEIVLIKVNNGFAYATDADREAASSWRLGKPIKVKATEQSARSLKFHQKYWAGLVALTFEYWWPDTGMTTEAERRLIESFCKILDDNGGDGTIAPLGDQFLATVSQNRAQKQPAVHKTKQALHDWIKEQAGYFEIELTPTGPRKKLKSINFNAMTNEQFEQFYKDAFNVCWRYVLSVQFDNEQDADNAVLKLLSVG